MSREVSRWADPATAWGQVLSEKQQQQQQQQQQ
jgi:hypothetical protein